MRSPTPPSPHSNTPDHGPREHKPGEAKARTQARRRYSETLTPGQAHAARSATHGIEKAAGLAALPSTTRSGVDIKAKPARSATPKRRRAAARQPRWHPAVAAVRKARPSVPASAPALLFAITADDPPLT